MTPEPPEPPEIDRRLGLGFYATTGPGVGGRLRVRPEDFQVTERGVKVADAHEGGKYTLALVESRNWETHKLVRNLASRLGISERGIFFAGTKDKRAVTVQHMAIRAPEDDVRSLELKDVTIHRTRRVDRAPKIGELAGNTFRVTIRELDTPLDEAVHRAQAVAEDIDALGGIPNFFGPQRFGSQRPNTHEIGEAILRGRYDEALETYLGDMTEVTASTPSLERGVLEQAAARPDDPLGALLTLPRNLTTMFVYAHQSLLFNRIIETRRRTLAEWPRPIVGDVIFGVDEDRSPDPDTIVPVRKQNVATVQRAAATGKAFVTGALFGHDVTLAEDEPGRIERDVLASSGFELDDFKVFDAPRLSAAGTRRPIIAPVHDLAVESGTDEVGEHVTVTFTLPKGAYATCVLREFMKVEAA